MYGLRSWKHLATLRERRDHIIRVDLRLNRSSGKKLILKVLGGAKLPAEWQDNDFMKRVRRLSRFLRWLACCCLPDVYAEKSQGEERWAEASTFAIWWQRCEDAILREWCQWIASLSASPAT